MTQSKINAFLLVGFIFVGQALVPTGARNKIYFSKGGIYFTLVTSTCCG